MEENVLILSQIKTEVIVLNIKPIAVMRSDLTTKFGIPRQGTLVSCLRGRIVFEKEYSDIDAFRGIEEYSHLWLLWGFSQCEKGTGERLEVKGKDNWSPTVRPPRLGGNKRMGVFATRSPFRPNPIGLTSVRLLRVEDTTEGLVLVVSGADLLDGTPIYDIKPYLSFSDSHPDAKNGFAEESKEYHLNVQINETLQQHVIAQGCPWDILIEILSQDPRPAYQNDPNRIYHLDYANWTVDFVVHNATVCIKKSRKNNYFCIFCLHT